jgi:Glycosyl transferases group 1/Glycosyl transferase 4-like domain
MKICIVNHVDPLLNPRTVKEADALSEADYDVRVVTVRKTAAAADAEKRLVAGRRWRCEYVNYAPDELAGYGRWFISGVTSRLFKQLSRVSLEGRIAEKAFCRFGRGMLKAALKEPADLYIAHNLPSLPVASQAASAARALLGFDIEDYHLDEDTPSLTDPVLKRLKEYLVRKYLPLCDYLSATSESMADAIKDTLAVRRPIVLYNMFPLSYRLGILPPEFRSNGQEASEKQSPYTAYWFSQVVGLDRGIQDFIQALPRLSKRVDVHLRGKINGNIKESLLKLAASLGVAHQVFFHDPIYAEDLVKDAARFDFGLALEHPVNQNRMITVTNKLFTYILAGIVPVATDTPGQREVVDQLAGTAVLYKPGDVDGLVQSMNAYLSNPIRIPESKKLVWAAGGSRFCWDLEKQKLLRAITSLDRNSTVNPDIVCNPTRLSTSPS